MRKQTGESGYERRASRGYDEEPLASAQEFAALTAVGFDPVGTVSGVTVVRVGYVGATGRCSGSTSYTPRTDLASATRGPLGVLVRQQYGVRRQAVARAVRQCVRLGADGIVGTRLRVRHFPAGGMEYTVQGIAVRARSRTHLANPFTTYMSGQKFALLINAGWIPVGLVSGIGLGSRHDTIRTGRQRRRFAPSTEVSGYSALVRDTRRDAHDQLRQAAIQLGAEGVIVQDMTLHISERECPSVEGQHDHVAQAEFTGTAIVAFHREEDIARSRPLTIMRLNPVSATSAALAKITLDPVEPLVGALPDQKLIQRFLARITARRASHSVYATRDSSSVTRRGGRE